MCDRRNIPPEEEIFLIDNVVDSRALNGNWGRELNGRISGKEGYPIRAFLDIAIVQFANPYGVGDFLDLFPDPPHVPRSPSRNQNGHS